MVPSIPGDAFLHADMGGVHTADERALRKAIRTLPHDGSSIGICHNIPRKFAFLVVLRVPEQVRVELVLSRHIGDRGDGVRGVRLGLLCVRPAGRLRGRGASPHVSCFRRQGFQRHGVR